MKINKESVLKSFKENLVIGVIIILILIGSYWFLIKQKKVDLIVPVEEYSSVVNSEDIVINESVDKLLKQNEPISKLPSEIITSKIVPPTLNVVNNPTAIFLTVSGESYQTNFQMGDTLFDLMNQLKNDRTKSFSFKYEEHPGLGIYINEINNVAESPGNYWLYYVNGVEASVGVGAYVLKEGDSILWRQE